MLELYHTLYSTCSQKVRFCLAEKQLSWVDRHVDLFKDAHLTPEYLKLNPNGVVPTLLHDGRPVIESAVIVEYLDDVFPDPPKAPRDAYRKAQMRAWMAFISEIPTSFIRVPTLHMVFKSRQTVVSQEEHAANVERRPVRKYIFRKLGASGFPDAELKSAIDGLRQSIERVDGALEDGPWILGDGLSLAEMVLIPTIDRMEDLGLDWMWADRPRFGDWWARIKARPAYAATYPAGARLSHYMPDIRDRTKAEFSALLGRIGHPDWSVAA